MIVDCFGIVQKPIHFKSVKTCLINSTRLQKKNRPYGKIIEKEYMEQ